MIPAIHLLVANGFTWMINNASFHWLLLMGAFYIIGAVVYASRFPERFWPGRCDYFVCLKLYSFFLKLNLF